MKLYRLKQKLKRKVIIYNQKPCQEDNKYCCSIKRNISK